MRKDNQVTIRTTYPRLDFLQTGGADDMQTGATDDGGQAEAHDSDEVKKEAEATISIKRLSKVLQALGARGLRPSAPPPPSSPPLPPTRLALRRLTPRPRRRRPGPHCIPPPLYSPAVVSDVRLWLGVLCLVPGQFVVLKLFIQDQEKSSAPPRVKS